MSNIKKIYNFLFSKVPFFQNFTNFHHRESVKEICAEISNYVPREKENYINIKNYGMLKDILKRFVKRESKHCEVVHEFLNSNIEICKEAYSFSDLVETDVIVVCVIRDDLKRLQEFIPYYRQLGVKHFAFLDNNSTDGTYEFLEAQVDVNLYRTSDSYTTNRREGWLNCLYQHIGVNKWILCVDSDELFTYIGMEHHSISDFVLMLKEKKIKRVRSIMIDMYSNKNIFEQEKGYQDSMQDYCYFDYDNYSEEKNFRSMLIFGGPRERVFSTNSQRFLCTLSKYPLFFYENGDFQGCSHWQFPYQKNYDPNIYAALRHYKFMNDDLEKYKERIIKGNYTSGSLEYKRYFEVLKENKTINFMCKESMKFEDSESFENIRIDSKHIIDLFDSNGDAV